MAMVAASGVHVLGRRPAGPLMPHGTVTVPRGAGAPMVAASGVLDPVAPIPRPGVVYSGSTCKRPNRRSRGRSAAEAMNFGSFS